MARDPRGHHDHPRGHQSGNCCHGGITEALGNVRHYLTHFPFHPRPYLLAGIFFALSITMLPYFAARQGQDPTVKPTQLNLYQLRTPQGRHQLGVRLVLGGGLGGGLGGIAWLRYAIAVSLAAHDKRIPLRFTRFLHWAYQAGLLRISGNAYQFRHIELRNWLQHPIRTHQGATTEPSTQLST